MLKFKTIKVPIFNWKIEFISGELIETVNYIQDVYNTIPIYDPNFTACCWQIKGQSIIWFEEETVTVPIINHEIGHAIFDMMIDRGIELTDQEVFCYSQEYVLEEFLKCTTSIQTEAIKLLSTQEDTQQSF